MAPPDQMLIFPTNDVAKIKAYRPGGRSLVPPGVASFSFIIRIDSIIRYASGRKIEQLRAKPGCQSNLYYASLTTIQFSG
jgi:hypothetical protein